MDGLTGKVLITGGTGSLGMSILKRAHEEEWPATFTVFARNEAKISKTQEMYPDVTCLVGDIQDSNFLRGVLPGFDLVIHAAAIKVIPLAEVSVRSTIMTNVIGTMNVCQVSAEVGVKRVITILTDKLIRSSTIYGASKALSGGITREANTWGNTRFSSVLYGNVLGSSSSLYPHLQTLKSQGKPFTITDARCTRFFLRMREAIDLILFAYKLDMPATTVVPKAGGCPIVELFKAVDPDWPIEDIGIRPGEKLHELMISDVEARYTEDCGDYFITHSPLGKSESNLPDGYEYSSEFPAHTLTREELKDMMENA